MLLGVLDNIEIGGWGCSSFALMFSGMGVYFANTGIRSVFLADGRGNSPIPVESGSHFWAAPLPQKHVLR